MGTFRCVAGTSLLGRQEVGAAKPWVDGQGLQSGDLRAAH